MDDHDQEEPDLKTGLYPKRAAAKSDDTSDEDFMDEAGEEDGGSDGMGGRQRVSAAGLLGDVRALPRREPAEHEQAGAHQGVPGAGEVPLAHGGREQPAAAGEQAAGRRRARAGAGAGAGPAARREPPAADRERTAPAGARAAVQVRRLGRNFRGGGRGDFLQ